MAEDYRYPSDIGEGRYENRSVTITVRRPTLGEGASAAYEKFKANAKEVFDEAKNIGTDVFTIKSNLEANSRTNEGEVVGTITLPLPNTFADSQNHGWSRETGIVGTALTALTTASTGGVVSSLAGKFLDEKTAKTAGQLTGDLSIDRVLGSASNLAGTRKPLIDPGYFQNYTGSEPRTFNMTFDLIPNNADEANQILMIIFKLKEWSSPTKVKGGVALLSPDWFDIKLSNPYLSALAKIDRVVLTSMNVDYGADGAMQQTADGMPKYISLSLTFQEADMTTSNDYNTRPVRPQ